MRIQHRHITWVLTAVALIALSSGCADRKDPVDVDIQTHPSGWLSPGDEDFHGEYVASVVQGNAGVAEEERRTGVEGCASCHGGEDLGRALDTGCFECHAAGNPELGGHAAANEFIPPSGDAFHGADIMSEADFNSCASCHGLEYRGGWAGEGCYECHDGPSGHPGPDVWFAPDAPGFHGAAVIAAQGVDRCRDCHGEDLAGGFAGAFTNCASACHPGGYSGHPEAEVGPWHVELLGTKGLNSCRDCHGEDLEGGWSGGSGSQAGCHTD